jgi:uncharacterized protein YdeI (YjbR/CyaY-like superfamily)
VSEITARDEAEWTAWLEANHETESEVWLVYWKKASGKESIAWAAAVEVALKFGWIDGVIRRIDDDRYAQRWTPRRPKSKWSLVNKEIVLRHIANGELRPRGLAAVEAAKASGESGGEGAAAACIPHPLGPLARLARRHGRPIACKTAEHDRPRARGAGVRGRRRRG